MNRKASSEITQKSPKPHPQPQPPQPKHMDPNKLFLILLFTITFALPLQSPTIITEIKYTTDSQMFNPDNWTNLNEIYGSPDSVPTEYNAIYPDIIFANFFGYDLGNVTYPIPSFANVTGFNITIRRKSAYDESIVECFDATVRFRNATDPIGDDFNIADNSVNYGTTYEYRVYTATDPLLFDPAVYQDPDFKVRFRVRCNNMTGGPVSPPYAYFDSLGIQTIYYFNSSLIDTSSSVYPNTPFEITVQNVHNESSLSYYCRVGTTVMTASYINDTTISCDNSYNVPFGDQSLAFSFDTTTWTEDVTSIQISSPEISSVSPFIITNVSAPINITVFGSNFQSAPGIVCIWSLVNSSVSVYSVNATFINDSAVSCLNVDPSAVLAYFNETTSGGANPVLNLSIAYDPIQYDFMLQKSLYIGFTDYLAIPASGFSPPIAAAYGGCHLTISNFTINEFLVPTLQFDFGNGTEGIINQVSLVNHFPSNSTIIIETPISPFPQFETLIRYSFDNGSSWSPFSESLFFFKTPTVTGFVSENPSSLNTRIPSALGGDIFTTNITILGSEFAVEPGFENLLTCGFTNGTNYFSFYIGSFINSSAIFCQYDYDYENTLGYSIGPTLPSTGFFNLTISLSGPQSIQSGTNFQFVTDPLALVEFYTPEVVLVAIPNSIPTSYSSILSLAGSFDTSWNITCGIGFNESSLDYIIPATVDSATAVSCNFSTLAGSLNASSGYRIYVSSNDYDYFGNLGFPIVGGAEDLIFLNTSSAVPNTGLPVDLSNVLSSNVTSGLSLQTVPQIAVVDSLEQPLGSWIFSITPSFSSYTNGDSYSIISSSSLFTHFNYSLNSLVEIVNIGFLSTNLNSIGVIPRFAIIGPQGVTIDLILHADGQGSDFGSSFTSIYNASITISDCPSPLIDSSLLNSFEFNKLLEVHPQPDQYQNLLGCICPPGYSTVFLDDHFRSCTLCPTNSYSLEYDSLSCTICPFNQIFNQNGTDGSLCECVSGSYTDPKDDTLCLSCPEHSSCTGGSEIVPDDGYWSSESEPAVIYRCINPDHCTQGKCVSGHQGPLCSLCDPGYTGRVGSQCSECPDSFVLGFIVILLLATFLGLSIVRILATLSGGIPSTTVVARITITFLQIAYLIGRLPTNWPAALSNFFTFASFAFGNVFSYNCSFNLTVYDEFLIILFTPFFILVIIFIYLFIRTYVSLSAHRTKVPSNLDNDDIPDFQTDTASTDDNTVSDPFDITSLSRQALRNTLFTYSLVVFYIFHPSITLSAFALFNCTEVNGKHYITSSMEAECQGTTYTIFSIISVLVILLYVVGFPFFAIRTMYRNRNNLHKLEAQFALRFFYYGYRLPSGAVSDTPRKHARYRTLDSVAQFSETEITDISELSSNGSNESHKRSDSLESVHILSFLNALEKGADISQIFQKTVDDHATTSHLLSSPVVSNDSIELQSIPIPDLDNEHVEASTRTYTIRQKVRNFIKSLDLAFYYEFIILFRKTIIVAVFAMSGGPFVSFWAILWIMYLASILLVDSDPYEDPKFMSVEAFGVFGHFLLASAGLLFLNVPVPDPFAVFMTVCALGHHLFYVIYLFYLGFSETPLKSKIVDIFSKSKSDQDPIDN